MNATELLPHLDKAIACALLWQRYDIKSPRDGDWSIGTQTKLGLTTGKVVVQCRDAAVLAEMVTAAKQAGHVVQGTRRPDTKLLTPKS